MPVSAMATWHDGATTGLTSEGGRWVRWRPRVVPLEDWDPRIRRYRIPGSEGAIQLGCAALERVTAAAKEPAFLLTALEGAPSDRRRPHGTGPRPSTAEVMRTLGGNLLGLISQACGFHGPGTNLALTGQDARDVLMTAEDLAVSRPVVLIVADPLRKRSGCVVFEPCGIRADLARPPARSGTLEAIGSWVRQASGEGAA